MAPTIVYEPARKRRRWPWILLVALVGWQLWLDIALRNELDDSRGQLNALHSSVEDLVAPHGSFSSSAITPATPMPQFDPSKPFEPAPPALADPWVAMAAANASKKSFDPSTAIPEREVRRAIPVNESFEKKTLRMKKGMSIDDVQELLGEPVSTTLDAFGLHWNYPKFHVIFWNERGADVVNSWDPY